MKYLFSTQAKIAKLTEEEYRGRCGHFDVLPIHLPADADPVKFLNFVQSRDRENGTNVYGRLLEMDAFLLARIANVCGGSARVQMMGLAFLKDNSDNILTRLMRDMYEYEASRAFLVGGGLGEDAKALVDAATFCNHPMVYLVPGFHPTNVDNIKRNDFAVACFLSFTFGWLIRPNMARRAFERDPVFSAALAIQKAAHLQRIAGLGGKAQAASGQLAAKAAAGGKAQAASGQLAAKAAAGRKAQAASGGEGAAWRKAQAASGCSGEGVGCPQAQAASALAGRRRLRKSQARRSSRQACCAKAQARLPGSREAAAGTPRWRDPTGVKKDGDKYAVLLQRKAHRHLLHARGGALRLERRGARVEQDARGPVPTYALYELSPEDTAKFESRDPRWRDPTGVKKHGDKYAVFFNGKRIGTYSTREAAYFVWNAAARDSNATHPDSFDKYALFPLSPEETATFESRDPRWREPTGVTKDGKEAGKYVAFFNKKRLGTYSTRDAAYFVWNSAAGEWNDKHADPFDKYALFPSTPGDEAR
jgi:hypothetical protein